MNDVCNEFWDSVGCDFVVNVEKWYIQTSILLFNDMVRWIFCYKIFFKKVFSFLWWQLRNFMFPHYYHIRENQTWKQNLFVRFFCLGFFVWIHMYHQLLIFLSHFVSFGCYFRLRNPLIGILSFVFLLLYLRYSSCVTLMYHRRNLLQNVFLQKKFWSFTSTSFCLFINWIFTITCSFLVSFFYFLRFFNSTKIANTFCQFYILYPILLKYIFLWLIFPTLGEWPPRRRKRRSLLWELFLSLVSLYHWKKKS